MASLASEIVGISEVSLDGRRDEVRSRETNARNLVADALLNQARALAKGFNAPLPQIAIQNGGGFVAESAIPPGTISRLAMFRMLRFPNIISIVPEISPAHLKQILENAVSRVEFHDGRFPQIAGFKLAWDPSGIAQILDADGNLIIPGTRVREVLLNDGLKIVEDGKVLAGAPSVSIATLEFLARGGDEYPFRNKPFVSLQLTYEEAARNYIRSQLGGLIKAERYPEGGEGRIERQ